MILDELFVVLGKNFQHKKIKIEIEEFSESDSDY